MAKSSLIRVLSLHWGFIPGGGATYARYINDVGQYAPIELVSVCINKDTWPLDKVGLEIINPIVVNIMGRWDVRWIWAMRNLVKKISPDLILTNGFNTGSVAFLSTIGFNIPIVSTWHGEYFATTLSQKIRKPIFDILIKILFHSVVREIVTVSNFSKSVLLRQGIDSPKLTVIHNGIPSLSCPVTEKYKQIRTELGLTNGGLLVGTACRLSTEKGLIWLLNAAKSIKAQRSDIRFVVWGDGPHRSYLEAMTKNLDIIDIFSFPGYRDNIDDCLAALDIFVMASSTENFSISLLEAMRSGLPIVTTNVGGNPEAIENGVNGFLVPYGDSDALAIGILKFADDPALREKMGEEAKNRFRKEFTSETMARKTAEWLFNCAQKYAVKS